MLHSMTRWHGGFGPTWQKAFGMHRPGELEAYCSAQHIELQWLDGDHVRTRQVRPAVITDASTGRKCWFNHVAFWHESALPPHIRKTLLDELGEDRLPYNTSYGDGAPIDGIAVAAITAAYRQQTCTFNWQCGDVLLLNNLTMAHGRSTYTGQRRMLASMGQPMQRQAAATTPAFSSL